jgi:hypothetical protein
VGTSRLGVGEPGDAEFNRRAGKAWEDSDNDRTLTVAEGLDSGLDICSCNCSGSESGSHGNGDSDGDNDDDSDGAGNGDGDGAGRVEMRMEVRVGWWVSEMVNGDGWCCCGRAVERLVLGDWGGW